uniref:Chaoptin n=1 Tax=Megaselia scalaris TaxID=36166 RepID=T1GLM5_MEGSC
MDKEQIYCGFFHKKLLFATEFNIDFSDLAQSNVSSITLSLPFDNNDENKISEVNNLLVNLTNIKTLKIDQYIEDTYLFNGLDNLENLSWLHIANDSSDYSFVALPKLRNLEIKRLKYKISDRKIIENINIKQIPNLKRLKFFNTYFNKISLDTNNIDHLDLSGNEISSLPEIIFQNKNILKYLNMSFNNIKSIEELISEGFLELKTLDLNNNHIKNVPKIILPKLRYLDLSYNFIEFLANDTFQNGNLSILKINDNFIKKYPTTFFNSMSFLKKLYLSINIQDIKTNNFADCKYLKTLFIDIKITNFNRSKIFLESFLQNCQSIEELHIKVSNAINRRMLLINDLYLKNLQYLKLQILTSTTT